MGKYAHKATITVSNPDEEIPHTTIHVCVNPFNETGSLVVADIVSDSYELDVDFLRTSSPMGLISCIGKAPEVHPVLESYRQKLLPLKEE